MEGKILQKIVADGREKYYQISELEIGQTVLYSWDLFIKINSDPFDLVRSAAWRYQARLGNKYSCSKRLEGIYVSRIS